MKNFVRNLLGVIIISFILHGIWEYVQCETFYTMSGQSSVQHTRLMWSATIGDIGIAVVLFLILTFINGNSNWLMKQWERKDIIVSILYALFVSFYFEVHALYNGRWGYSGEMPFFPTTNIGLLPVIQLLILLPLSFIIVRYIYRRLNIST
ncbi:hypothetical protein [Selenihalanaerobacter shriftii]|uniref:Uncharacterized protein n=1 Tax=Selenihalanaerobacter shriftii TaxID=142842 RepID=A0A1T4K5M3_9FIRM|nr:hypothetical protein [Selenihalanaerobacter shriftii]SJZ37702.1 hypothetical protein SAMN02745118_00624 [Selenihalanaerobacter shriftii]